MIPHSWKRRIVAGLERACSAMRHFQRIPIFGRLYGKSYLARWSYRLDRRWGTHFWPFHDSDSWEEWWEQEKDSTEGHYHAFPPE